MISENTLKYLAMEWLLGRMRNEDRLHTVDGVQITSQYRTTKEGELLVDVFTGPHFGSNNQLVFSGKVVVVPR